MNRLPIILFTGILQLLLSPLAFALSSTPCDTAHELQFIKIEEPRRLTVYLDGNADVYCGNCRAPAQRILHIDVSVMERIKELIAEARDGAVGRDPQVSDAKDTCTSRGRIIRMTADNASIILSNQESCSSPEGNVSNAAGQLKTYLYQWIPRCAR